MAKSIFDALLKPAAVSCDRFHVEVTREAPGNEVKNPWPRFAETAVEDALGYKAEGLSAGKTEIRPGVDEEKA